jgi:hypothetical protein
LGKVNQRRRGGFKAREEESPGKEPRLDISDTITKEATAEETKLGIPEGE